MGLTSDLNERGERGEHIFGGEYLTRANSSTINRVGYNFRQKIKISVTL